MVMERCHEGFSKNQPGDMVDGKPITFQVGTFNHFIQFLGPWHAFFSNLLRPVPGLHGDTMNMRLVQTDTPKRQVVGICWDVGSETFTLTRLT